MYVIALIAFFITGTVASPPVYEAYRTEAECQALLQVKLNQAQKDMDDNMGAGNSKVFGSCVKVIPAGAKA